MTWVLFDYGDVICEPQPEHDVAALARVGRLCGARPAAAVLGLPAGL